MDLSEYGELLQFLYDYGTEEVREEIWAAVKKDRQPQVSIGPTKDG